MKKISIIIFAAFAALVGCNRQLIEVSQDVPVSFSMSADDDYDRVDLNSDGKVIPASKAVAGVDVNDFTLDLVRNSDGLTKHFDRFGDMPQVINLPSGVYTLTASSPDVLPAAFDQPVFGANQQLVVNVGEARTETITCTLQNIMVTFSLSNAFVSELSSYTISVSNGDAVQNTLYWTNLTSATEDRYTTKNIAKAGYFAVAPLNIRVDGKRATDGSEAYHEIRLLDVKARTHLMVNLDAKVTGSAGFQITIDPGVNQRPEDVFVPGFDETPVPELPDPEDPVDPEEPGDGGETGGETPDTPSAMTLKWVGNESFETAEIVSGMAVDLQLTVPEGIKEFLITVTSDTPMFMFLVSNMTSSPGDYATMDQIESVEIDLINDPVAVSAMAADGIELPTGENLLGKTYVDFPLSNLVPMIPEMGGAGPDTYHTFNLKVEDSKGNVCDWDLTFHVPAQN